MKTRPVERRARAEVRQAEYAALTLDQKLERISGRPGENKRELARLTKKSKLLPEATVQKLAVTDAKVIEIVVKKSKGNK